MNSRSVTTLRVLASVRQVDAYEPGVARGFGYLLFTVGPSWFLTQTDVQVNGIPVIIAFIAVINLVLFRPFQLALNVDVDTSSCRVAVRMFGVIPVFWRHHELGDRRFAVEARHETKQSKGADLGCLMMALPFPLSLLSLVLGGGGGRIEHRSWVVLCLRGSDGEPVDDLVQVRDREVTAPLLEALRDLLPGHVE